MICEILHILKPAEIHQSEKLLWEQHCWWITTSDFWYGKHHQKGSRLCCVDWKCTYSFNFLVERNPFLYSNLTPYALEISSGIRAIHTVKCWWTHVQALNPACVVQVFRFGEWVCIQPAYLIRLKCTALCWKNAQVNLTRDQFASRGTRRGKGRAELLMLI